MLVDDENINDDYDADEEDGEGDNVKNGDDDDDDDDADDDDDDDRDHHQQQQHHHRRHHNSFMIRTSGKDSYIWRHVPIMTYDTKSAANVLWNKNDTAIMWPRSINRTHNIYPLIYTTTCIFVSTMCKLVCIIPSAL